VLTCYTLGDDVIAQKKSYWQWVDLQWELQSTDNTQYLLYDGHGSTRQLVTGSVPNTTIVDDFSYDGYGVLLQNEDNFPPAGTQVPGKVGAQATSLLYAGEYFDTDSQNYYLRARWYDSLSGRFNRMDPFPGNNQDPQSLHKYLYCHANPVNAIDPSGAMTYAAQLTVADVIGQLIVAYCPYVMAGLLILTTVATLALIYELTHEYIAAGLTAVASVIMSNTKVVVKAINDAAKALGRTVKQLQKFKFFPVIRRFTPSIFAFNVAALATHPWWFMLKYNGTGNPLTATNRLWVAATYGYMMLTAPPGYQLDEFPYACTAQGGAFGPALAHLAPAWENALQGGFLGAFTRLTLKGVPQPFIVVPIPL